MLELRPIIEQILIEYSLPIDGTHGVAHWARVHENGHRLCEALDVNADVVSLFAVFHDARRINEYDDPGHGRRGAELARSLHGRLFRLAPDDLDRLLEACSKHTDELTHDDLTVQVCFDADRLDLGRVGIQPDPNRLCTDAARAAEMLRWADGNAGFGVVPDLVMDQWGLQIS